MRAEYLGDLEEYVGYARMNDRNPQPSDKMNKMLNIVARLSVRPSPIGSFWVNPQLWPALGALCMPLSISPACGHVTVSDHHYSTKNPGGRFVC